MGFADDREAILMAAPGDRTDGWCYFCERFVTATFATGSFPTDDGTLVRDVLRGTCDECGTVVALGPEATPTLHAAFQKSGRKTRSRLRVQSDLLTSVGSQLSAIGQNPCAYDLLINGFIVYAVGARVHWRKLASLVRQVDDPLLHLPLDAAITLNLTPRAWAVLEELEDASNVSGTGDLVRRLFLPIVKDWKAVKPVGAGGVLSEVKKLAYVS